MITKITFDDDTLAWTDLLNAVPGSQFITSDHTLQHCRDGLMPINFIRMTRDEWDEKSHNDIVARASEFCKNILSKAEPIVLPGHLEKEMDAIVEGADKSLC